MHKPVLFFSAILTIACSSFADTIIVDANGTGDYPTIQEAIDDANNGDVIILNPGTYTGPNNIDIDYLGKAITIRSTNPNDWSVVEQTAIDPNFQGIGFYFQNNEDANSILDGITVRRGRHFFFYDSLGGISCVGGSAIIRNCIVTECFGDGIALFDCNVAVENCIITKNGGWFDHIITGSGIRLGGIGAFNIPTIKDCIISDNYQSGVRGAGGYIGGYATIINCLFSNNKGDIPPMSAPEYPSYGGGIFLTTGGMSIINCTFVGNKADLGGAICCMGSMGGANLYRLNIENCIIKNNHADYGQQIAVQYIGGAKPELNINHSNIQGGEEDIFLDYGEFSSALNWQTGNIDVDPCFVDPGYWDDPCNTPGDANDDVWVDGDYRLKSEGGRWDPDSESWILDDVTSSCIDAGDPNSLVGDEPLPNGGRINMGAYGGTGQASKSLTCWNTSACAGQPFGDATCDGKVDFADLFALRTYWAQAAPWVDPECCADFSHDGVVSFADLFALKAGWGTSGYSPSIGNQLCPQ